jgi:hypothetical protein
VALRMLAGRTVGESVEDLQDWLSQLSDCPPIHSTVVASCRNERHADEPATWFFVESDPIGAVARRRCLSCGDAHDTLDSADHWPAPRMWACSGCAQSIAEVVTGVHAENDQVTWVAVGARCVNCGLIAGLTDFTPEPQPFDAIVDAL